MHISTRSLGSLSAIAVIAAAFAACEARSPRNPDRTVSAFRPMYDYPRDGGSGGSANRRSVEASNPDPEALGPAEPIAVGDPPAYGALGGTTGSGGAPGKAGKGGYGSGTGGVGGRMTE